MTHNLPETWHESPNAHLCTIRDFADLCDEIGAKVEQAVAFNASGRRLPIKWSLSMQNLLGEKAVFRSRAADAPHGLPGKRKGGPARTAFPMTPVT